MTSRPRDLLTSRPRDLVRRMQPIASVASNMAELAGTERSFEEVLAGASVWRQVITRAN